MGEERKGKEKKDWRGERNHILWLGSGEKKVKR